jgi:hypothetical protein
MGKVGWLVLVLAGLAFVAGCVTNPIVGHGAVAAGRYTGDVGITGNGTTLTIQVGSDVPKLSIVGDANKVTVEDGARVGRVEFWGTSNTVTIPDNLNPIVASVGVNKVLHRSESQTEPAERAATTKPAGQTP